MKLFAVNRAQPPRPRRQVEQATISFRRARWYVWVLEMFRTQVISLDRISGPSRGSSSRSTSAHSSEHACPRR